MVVARFLRGVELFNAGYYWEAHEVWEELWHVERRVGPTAEVLKALIKLAAAGVKARERREGGVRTHCHRAAVSFALAAGQGGPRQLWLDLEFWAGRFMCWRRIRRGITVPRMQRQRGFCPSGSTARTPDGRSGRAARSLMAPRSMSPDGELNPTRPATDARGTGTAARTSSAGGAGSGLLASTAHGPPPSAVM